MSQPRNRIHPRNRIEEVAYIRNYFWQCGKDEAKKIWLVRQILDVARWSLPPEAIPKMAMAMVTAGWARTLESLGVNLTPGQRSAANLFGACTEALSANAVSERLQQNILAAYPGLEFDTLIHGENYLKAQAKKARKPRGKVSDNGDTIGRIIGALAVSRGHEDETARELWPNFYAKLEDLELDPEESDDEDESVIDYCFNGGRKAIKFTTFEKVVSAYRTGKKFV